MSAPRALRHGAGAGLLVLLLAYGHASWADADALWRLLADGGKVVLVRHAPVATGAQDGDPRHRDPTCRAERNLSAAGREAAAELGRRFRDRGVAVDRVLHSPYCRTTDTARLAFGAAEPAAELALLEVLPAAEAAQQTAALQALIASHAGPGTLVLVTHEPNIRAVSFELVRHLDAVVVEPGPGDAFEELGVIRFLPRE